MVLNTKKGVSPVSEQHLQLRHTDMPPRPVNKKMRLKESGGLAAGLMLAPSLIFLCICSIYPFIWIFRYIGYNYNGFTARYVGTANFTRMFNDATFWGSVLTTFEYAFWKLIIIIPLALIMAVLLNQKLRGSSFFRGAFFMPTVIATSISGMIFTFIFATQNGILNTRIMPKVSLAWSATRKCPPNTSRNRVNWAKKSPHWTKKSGVMRKPTTVLTGSWT